MSIPQIEKILLGLRNSGLWNNRSDIMIPNVSWGLLNYEADFVVLSKSGYLTEVEIKRSFEDFKADFKKTHHHDDERVYYFYYCVHNSFADKAIELLREKEKEKKESDIVFIPAVLVYDDNGIIVRQVGNRYNKGNHRKLFIEEKLTLARLGCLRYWALLEKCLTEEYR